jgi:hypothetical protein
MASRRQSLGQLPTEPLECSFRHALLIGELAWMRETLWPSFGFHGPSPIKSASSAFLAVGREIDFRLMVAS